MIGRQIRCLALALLSGSLALSGCGTSGTEESPSGSAGTSDSGQPTVLHVLAAASLHDPFTDLGRLFEADHPGTAVELTFAGSPDLISQLSQGAPADVLATADTANMDKAVKSGLVGIPVNFASNTLTIAVAPGNPKHIASFADLAGQGLDVVVCAAQVPCGAAAVKIADSLGVHLNPVSEESSVTDVLNKVTSGQADAGLVYVTDAKSAGAKITAVNIPEAAGAVNVYPISVATGTRNPQRASEFVHLVTGEAGRKVLTEAGFSEP